MLRFVPLAAAVATSAMLLGATAGHAAQSRGYYVATALEAPAKANFVTRSTAWSCDGAVCTAAREPARVAFVCERLAGISGALRAFPAGGDASDSDTLTPHEQDSSWEKGYQVVAE